jgi:hypothetical protein
MPHVNPARGKSGDVEKTAGIEPHSIQEPVNSTNLELGEIGQKGSQVRRAYGCEGEHSSTPVGIGDQSSGVQPSEAVADHVY